MSADLREAECISHLTHAGTPMMQLKALWSGKGFGRKTGSKAIAHNAVRRHAVSAIVEGLDEIEQAAREQRLLARVDAEMARGLARRDALVAELSVAHAAVLTFSPTGADVSGLINAASRVSSLARQLGNVAHWLSDIQQHREVVLGVRSESACGYGRDAYGIPRVEDYDWYDPW
jgi:hypothetical protein